MWLQTYPWCYYYAISRMCMWLTYSTYFPIHSNRVAHKNKISNPSLLMRYWISCRSSVHLCPWHPHILPLSIQKYLPMVHCRRVVGRGHQLTHVRHGLTSRLSWKHHLSRPGSRLYLIYHSQNALPDLT